MDEKADDNEVTTMLLNAVHLEQEVKWFSELAAARMQQHRAGEDDAELLQKFEPPVLEADGTPFGNFVGGNGLSPVERLLLIMSLIPHIRPGALDVLMEQGPEQISLSPVGGVRGKNHKGLIPTAETVLFVLCGKGLLERFYFQSIFDQRHPLFMGKWLSLGEVPPDEPRWSAVVAPSRELVEYLSTGEMGNPEFGQSFPAERITTERTWAELVLPGETIGAVQEVLDWILHEEMVMKEWGLDKKVAPGYRALFYGPPGTGKTFTTTLLGQASGREVYRIDLSMVVSKYIGETEKNLKNVFDKAQSRGWILFFDEADALFGQRTAVSDSKDRFANQEVSYLLQRVENFDGVAVLATNNRENLDDAFTRRFQSVVYFPMPNPQERLQLWKSALPDAFSLGPDVDLPLLANRFELAGGSIINVIRTCGLNAARRGAPVLRMGDFMDGIRKEFQKTGRILN